MKRSCIGSVLVVAMLVVVSDAKAAIVVLNSGSFGGTYNYGEGGGRGIGVHADSSFSIDTLGIFGDLTPRSYTVEVYSSVDGSSTSGLLASASATVGGTGNGWNDISISFPFSAGNYYVLHWRPTVSDYGNWVNTLDYYNDIALPVTVGPVTLINGEEGFTPSLDFSNTLHPNLRINTVSGPPIPEPSTVAVWGLLILCGIGIGWRRRRKA